jgi:hypothetical protein
MATGNTGSVFFNKAQSSVADDKLQGPQYEATVDGKPAVLAKAADDTVTIKYDGQYMMLKPNFNKYGAYYIETIGSQKYFFSERTNDRGKYWLAKLAKPRDGAGEATTPAAPKTYGKRA